MRSEDRGLSPVVGVALLLAIVVLLAVVSGGLIFGLTTERQPPPEVELAAEHRLVHESGEPFDGDDVELLGATDPDALEGSELAAGDREAFYAVNETIELVWYGDDGASYVLREFEIDGGETVPAPDEGCPWVDSESNDGTDSVTVDGLVVDCDVETDEQVTVKNGGVVIGDTVSDLKDVDADDAEFYGDADVENVFNLQDGLVTGSVDSDTADVKLDNATVGGSATAEKVVELQGASTVEGDAKSETKAVKVLDGSTVEGDAVSETDQAKVTGSTVSGAVYGGGSVDLDDATIEGDVYAADFDCTDSTINGQDCAAYAPEDPGDY
jgi:flagellin-like protein